MFESSGKWSWEIQKDLQTEVKQLKEQLGEKNKRIEDLEFYVRQFLDVLASTHTSHKEALPKLLSHLNHLVNPKDESGEMLRGERE